MPRPSISDLPDALLTAILGFLSQADLRRAALASRRWHACAHAPQLCSSVRSYAPSPVRLRSLLPWLLRHGRHVRRLDLILAAHSQEAEQLLGACLGVCAAVGQLQSLVVTACEYWAEPLLVSSWAPALTGLQRLALRAREASLEVTASLHPLAALRRLELCGSGGVRLAPGVRLPPGLEEVSYWDWQGDQLPAQLASLSSLRVLELSGTLRPWGCGVLERMCCLRHLHCCIDGLPACLPRLRQLQELVVSCEGQATGAALDAALQELTGLTSLALIDTPSALQVPPSVAGLGLLQHACFSFVYHRPPEDCSALPTGPWAASLRQLGASHDVLLLSGPLLAAASQLTELGVLGGDLGAPPSNASDRFWRWCAAHPPLRRLHIEAERDKPLPAPVPAAVEALRGTRPALLVECHHGVGSPFSDAFGFF